jgi:hypothetical protein
MSPIFVVFLESAATYSTSLLMLLISYVLNWNAQYILLDVVRNTLDCAMRADTRARRRHLLWFTFVIPQIMGLQNFFFARASHSV